MKQQDLFNEPLYDYCFQIRPDVPTVEAVKELKQQVHDQIVLSWANLSSKPQLTLIEFRATATAEEQIVSKTMAVLKEQGTFPVALDGAIVWTPERSTGSLVLKVKDAKPIRAAQSLLRKALHLQRQKLIPHLSIAGDVPSGKIASLEDFAYTGQFQCDRILLLKKPAATAKSYTVVYEAMLQSPQRREARKD